LNEGKKVQEVKRLKRCKRFKSLKAGQRPGNGQATARQQLSSAGGELRMKDKVVGGRGTKDI